MDGKTKIWRGGLTGLTQGAERAPAPEPVRPISPVVRGRDVSVREPARLDIHVDTKPSGLQATRILPIEQLLPASARVLTGAASARSPSRPHAARDAGPRRRGVLGHVAIGLLTLLAVTAWQLPSLLTGLWLRPHSLAPLTAARANASQTAANTPALDTPVHEVAAAGAQQHERPRTLASFQSSQRAAVDALIAGDYASAEQRYLELARAAPDRPVFAEAARILATRATRSSR